MVRLTIFESITYYGLNTFSFFVRLFDRKISIIFGKVIGLIIYFIIPIRKKVAKLNLTIAFPKKSENEINQIIKECYQHFGIVMMDLLRTKNLNKKNIQSIVEIEPSDLKLLMKESGGIIITGHIGSWEMMLPIFGINKLPFSVVVQFQRNKGAQKFFNEIRQFNGSKTILKGIKSSLLLNEISKGKFLGLASDQNAGKKGVMVQFFGKETSIPKGAAIFKMKSKAPLFFCYCVSVNDNRYKLFVDKLDINLGQIEPENKVEEICKLIALDLENIVRKYPEQYFWFHRKWPKKIYKN